MNLWQKIFGAKRDDPGLPPTFDQNLKAVALSPRASEIARAASAHGWRVEQEQKNIGLVILVRGSEQVNIYYTRMTVGTCIAHPTKGKTQLFRRNVTEGQLEQILANPRVHTGRGYYERK